VATNGVSVACAAHRAENAGARLRAWTMETFSWRISADQARGVAQHRQRVLGLHRHLGQARAVRLQPRRHPPAARGHQGRAARADHGLGHVDRRLLRAAGLQLGNDLQQGEIGG
jgi:hypothetical protein